MFYYEDFIFSISVKLFYFIFTILTLSTIMFFSLCIYSIVLVLLSVKHLKHFYETKQSQQPNSTSDIAEPQKC